MLVKTNRCFYDLREDTYRNVGDEFEVSKSRFDELNELVNGFVEEVKEIKEDAPEDEDKTQEDEDKTQEDEEVTEEVEENQEDLTVAEIKEKLDEAGIEYKAKATKSELLELLK